MIWKLFLPWETAHWSRWKHRRQAWQRMVRACPRRAPRTASLRWRCSRWRGRCRSRTRGRWWRRWRCRRRRAGGCWGEGPWLWGWPKGPLANWALRTRASADAALGTRARSLDRSLCQKWKVYYEKELTLCVSSHFILCVSAKNVTFLVFNKERKIRWLNLC